MASLRQKRKIERKTALTELELTTSGGLIPGQWGFAVDTKKTIVRDLVTGSYNTFKIPTETSLSNTSPLTSGSNIIGVSEITGVTPAANLQTALENFKVYVDSLSGGSVSGTTGRISYFSNPTTLSDSFLNQVNAFLIESTLNDAVVFGGGYSGTSGFYNRANLSYVEAQISGTLAPFPIVRMFAAHSDYTDPKLAGKVGLISPTYNSQITMLSDNGMLFTGITNNDYFSMSNTLNRSLKTFEVDTTSTSVALFKYTGSTRLSITNNLVTVNIPTYFNGYVGIGNPTPAFPVDIFDNTNPYIKIRTTLGTIGPGLLLQSNTSALYFQYDRGTSAAPTGLTTDFIRYGWYDFTNNRTSLSYVPASNQIILGNVYESNYSAGVVGGLTSTVIYANNFINDGLSIITNDKNPTIIMNRFLIPSYTAIITLQTDSTFSFTAPRFNFIPTAVGSSKFFIAADGNIGISYTSPTHPIHHVSGAHLTVGGMWIDASSRKRKTDIITISTNKQKELYDLLDEINPVTFKYKVDMDKIRLGFIAEDVPELISEKNRDSISPMSIAALAITLIKHQKSKIEELEKEINSLKNK